MTDSTVINKTLNTTAVTYDSLKDWRANKELRLINKINKLVESSIEFNINAPILNEIDGQPIENLTDVKAAYDIIENDIETAYNLLDGVQKLGITNTSKYSTAGDLSSIQFLKSRYEITAATFTSEWGTSNVDTYLRRLLTTTLGILNDPFATPEYSSRNATTDDSVRFIERPRTIRNVGRSYHSHEMNQTTEFTNNDSTRYTYGMALGEVMFIKNTNLTTAKTITFQIRGSAYSSYSYTGVATWEPNATNTNRASISSFTFALPYSTSSSLGSFTTVTITIPADKTLIIMPFAHVAYYTTNINFKYLELKNLGTILTDPQVVQDNDAFNNFAQSYKINGKNEYTNLKDIFTTTPSYDNMDILFNPSLAKIAVDDTAAGVLGVPVNGLYKNTTIGNLKIRIA